MRKHETAVCGTAALGPDAIIGISAHNLEEALEAQAQGADYLGVGALYPTGSKKDASLLPAGMLEKIVQAVRIPVAGIGGIQEDRMEEVLDQGAAGCAMISAILGAPDITAAVSRMKALIQARQQ